MSSRTISRLVLASSSQTRRQVLSKLQIDFEIFAPNIDESSLPGESPSQLVERLSVEKSLAATTAYPGHLIVGSDQVAVVCDQVLGKPKDRNHAISQLETMSGNSVVLFTGLALLNSETGSLQSDVLQYRVNFRNLNREMIENYIDKDHPFDCGGSLRSEGLGIALLTEFDGSDPNILLGLPLIRLIDMLSAEGYSVL